jgi:hypothetical protein
MRSASGTDQASGVVVTRPPGYFVRIAPDQLDLQRFEDLVARGVQALADGQAQTAAATLREALALWRIRLLKLLLRGPT